jgi:hypothetical protein
VTGDRCSDGGGARALVTAHASPDALSAGVGCAGGSPRAFFSFNSVSKRQAAVGDDVWNCERKFDTG